MKDQNLKRFIRTYMDHAPLFMSFIRPVEADLFVKHMRYVKKPVLDFGCGDGFFCGTVFGKGAVDIGLDLVGNRRTEQAKKDRIYRKLIRYDGRTIPLPSNYVATVISNCVLEHIPDVAFSLSEIRRILKPGGYFITSVMTSRWNEYLWGRKLFREFYVNYMNRAQAHASLFSENGWNKAFVSSGLSIVSKTGYLHRKNAQYLDLFHYFSIPSLLSYAFFGKWVLLPQIARALNIERLVYETVNAPDRKNHAAVFYVLKKGRK